jgi:hypothetical protein
MFAFRSVRVNLLDGTLIGSGQRWANQDVESVAKRVARDWHRKRGFYGGTLQ